MNINQNQFEILVYVERGNKTVFRSSEQNFGGTGILWVGDCG